MIRRPPRSTRTHTLSLHDALPIFYRIYILFRRAAIFQGIKGRVRDGTNSNPRAEKLVGMTEPLARLALGRIEAWERGSRDQRGTLDGCVVGEPPNALLEHFDQRLRSRGPVPDGAGRDMEGKRRYRLPAMHDTKRLVELGRGGRARKGEGKGIGALDDPERPRAAVDAEMRTDGGGVARVSEIVHQLPVRIGGR